MQLVVHFSAKKPETRLKRERGYYSDSDSEESIVEHAVEYKKKAFECMKCGEVFEKSDATCRWHSGTYSLLFSEQVPESPANNVSKLDSSYDVTQHLHTEERRQWTCCGEKIRTSVGCVTGNHQVNSRSDETLDQKLVSLFSSNTALEPLEIVAKPTAAANPANPMDNGDEDQDLQFIGRAQLLGNANPQGTVELTPVLAQKKCFALNESTTHSLESILFLRGPGVQYLESDCDAELLITVGFNSNVKLHLIRLLALDVSHAPASIRIFINKAARINFDNAASIKPDQEFELDDTNYAHQNIAILKLQASKFTLVETITLHITKNIGDEATTIIQALHFIGIAPNVR